MPKSASPNASDDAFGEVTAPIDWFLDNAILHKWVFLYLPNA